MSSIINNILIFLLYTTLVIFLYKTMQFIIIDIYNTKNSKMTTESCKLTKIYRKSSMTSGKLHTNKKVRFNDDVMIQMI